MSDPVKSFISGGAGGMAAVVVGQPFDMVKVQLQNSNKYKGSLDCAKDMVRTQGVRSLYRGLAAPMTGVTPIFALSFAGNAAGCNMVRAITGHEKLNYGELFCGGMLAGVYSTVIMAPGERIKCLLQTQPGKYKGMGDCAKQLYADGGIRNLYRGTILTLARDVPASGCYFGMYAYIKDQLTPEGQELSISSILVAGGLAGMANWAIGIPPDTLKTRFQTDVTGKYSGIKDVYAEVIAQGGFKQMFRGFGVVMLRAFPANASCFLAMEMTKSGLDKLW